MPSYFRSGRKLVGAIPKARSGKPSIGIHKLIEKVSHRAFVHELEKLADEDALARSIERQLHRNRLAGAAETVQNARSPRKHIESAAISSAVGPVSLAAGRAVKAFADAKRGRGRAALDAVKGITRGDVAQSMVGGAILGGGLSTARTYADVRKAKRTLAEAGLEVSR